MIKIKIPELDKNQLNALLGIIAGLLFLIFGSFFLLFRPQIRAIRNYRSQADAIEQKVFEAEVKIASKAKLLSQIAEIKESLSQYDKKLPRKRDIPVLLEELTEIVELAEIEIVSIRPQESFPIESLVGSGGQGVYLRLPIQIEIRCAFHNLQKFLFRLENTKRFVKVADINIKGCSSFDAAPVVHKIGLTIEIYMYEEAVSLT